MSKPPAVSARDHVRSFAPKLIDLTEKVVYGDVWERPGLSKRDRSLITCAALIAMNRAGRGDHAHGFLLGMAHRHVGGERGQGRA